MIGSTIEGLSRNLWNPSIWLPYNVTWDHFDSDPRFAQFNHLALPIPFALIFFVIRICLDRLVYRPTGIRLGLSAGVRKSPPDNAMLEEAWTRLKGRRLTGEAGRKLAGSTGMEVRQVERWMRQRTKASLPTTLDKFRETCWRWTFYLTAHLTGIYLLWDKPWLWNIRECFYQYPNHFLDDDIWWYYMLELSFYWSLTFTQFVEVKRKDFWEMFIHHIVTNCLLMFSWTNHFTRIGSLVLFVHDCADHWLELAKLAKYTKFQKCCDVLFMMFTLVWISTRLGAYPNWILYACSAEAAQILEMWPIYYIFNSWLATLLVLHLFWTYFMLKIVYLAILSGSKVKDARSDSEIEENSDSDDDTDNEDSAEESQSVEEYKNK